MSSIWIMAVFLWGGPDPRFVPLLMPLRVLHYFEESDFRPFPDVAAVLVAVVC
jgi:hypothetical protein